MTEQLSVESSKKDSKLIQKGTKLEAIDYLLKRSTPKHLLSSKDIVAFEKLIIKEFDSTERIIGAGHSSLSHLNKKVVAKAANIGIELPKFFSIVLSTNSFLVSEKFGDPLHSVSVK